MGFEMMFFVQQRMIHLKMAKKIKIEQNLERIVLSKEQAQKYLWDDGKELKIDDKMYDIGRQEDKGDSIVYYAAFDDEEVHLMAKIESFFDFKSKSDSDGKLELQLVKFLTLVTLIPSSLDEGKTEFLITSLTDISPHFTSVTLIPDTLPPRLS
jgi:hypothetical protein